MTAQDWAREFVATLSPNAVGRLSIDGAGYEWEDRLRDYLYHRCVAEDRPVPRVLAVLEEARRMAREGTFEGR